MSLGINLVRSRTVEEIHSVDLHLDQLLEIERVPFPVIALQPEYDDTILHLFAADDLLHTVHGTGLSLINLSVPDALRHRDPAEVTCFWPNSPYVRKKSIMINYLYSCRKK